MRARAAVVATCWIVLVARAHADDKPWAAGVAADEQKIALAIYDQGNKEFEESRYAQALAKYREALKHWDHPAIHFNIGVALVNLDEPLEAYPHFIAAMKFGDAPLGADKFAKAGAYKEQLDQRLGHVRVTCDIADAEVTFDGKPLLHGPGEGATLALPGEHQIVASKAGYVTETTRLTLAPGDNHVHAVHLVLVPVKTRYVGGMSMRRKLAIATGSVAGASLATGIVLGVIANSKRDQAFALCDPHVPCADAQKADALALSGHHYAIGADVAFAAAGLAALGAGALWLTGGNETTIVPGPASVAIVGRF